MTKRAATPIASSMMAAVQRQSGGPLLLETLPVPVPRPGEVLVRVRACGVCHSDVHALDGDWTPGPVLPLTPGHEVTGHVAALGPGVKDLVPGATVGVPWMWSACGRCEWCLAGMETICPSGQATGYSKPGGFAEYLVAPAAFVARLPDDADLAAVAPLLCAGVTTYRGLKRSGARAGQWLAVLGVGGLGHIALQYGKAMGLKVAALDTAPEKLELARALGADLALEAGAADAVKSLKTATGGGVHAALVTATARPAFEQAIALLRPAGTAVFLGLPGGGDDQIRASITAIAGRELTIRGSSIGTRQDLDEAVAFALQAGVAARIERLPLAEAAAALDRLRAGSVSGRLVLEVAPA